MTYIKLHATHTYIHNIILAIVSELLTYVTFLLFNRKNNVNLKSEFPWINMCF